MDIQKQILNLKKQNDGMESSFKAKDIKFIKLINIENIDPDLELILLKEHNEYLKNISQSNKISFTSRILGEIP